ncbi:MAG: hypothetical protein L6Q99_04340 [Planctomycetes bacterium]|nr:hypothetical protein [Planctomycetota bacterium]
MILKRVAPLSLAKILGVTYAAFGVFAGLFVAAMTVLGSTFGRGEHTLPEPGVGVLAILIFPMLYGAIGFVGGVVVAFIYNVAAGAVGGLEFELSREPRES